MKRIISIISIGLISTFLLSGCGSEQSAEEKKISELKEKYEMIKNSDPMVRLMLKNHIEDKEKELTETPLEKTCRTSKSGYYEMSSEVSKYADYYSGSDLEYLEEEKIPEIEKELKYSCDTLKKYKLKIEENNCISRKPKNDIETKSEYDEFIKYYNFKIENFCSYTDKSLAELHNEYLCTNNLNSYIDNLNDFIRYESYYNNDTNRKKDKCSSMIESLNIIKNKKCEFKKETNKIDVLEKNYSQYCKN
jgi:hypothetical protein